jgi:hypothetical protein
MPIISTTRRLRATGSAGARAAASATGRGPGRPGGGVRHRAGPGADAFGERRDDLGIQPVGFGEPAGGAGEGRADLARVDHGQRQAGPGEGGGHGDLEAAGGLEHHERRGQDAELRDQPVEALAAARDGDGPARRAQVHVEAVLGDVDADEGRRSSGGRLAAHDPSSWMRARGGCRGG